MREERQGALRGACMDINHWLSIPYLALEQVGLPRHDGQRRAGAIAREASKTIDMKFVLSGEHLNFARVVREARDTKLSLFAKA